MSDIKVYNTTNRPVVIDDGKIIGGHEHAQVEETEVVKRRVRDGTLRQESAQQEEAPRKATTRSRTREKSGDESQSTSDKGA